MSDAADPTPAGQEFTEAQDNYLSAFFLGLTSGRVFPFVTQLDGVDVIVLIADIGECWTPVAVLLEGDDNPLAIEGRLATPAGFDLLEDDEAEATPA